MMASSTPENETFHRVESSGSILSDTNLLDITKEKRESARSKSHNDMFEGDALELIHSKKRRRSASMVAITRLHSAYKMKDEKKRRASAVNLAELTKIRANKHMAGKLSLRNHGLILIKDEGNAIPLPAPLRMLDDTHSWDSDKDSNDKSNSQPPTRMMHINLVNEFIKGDINVHLLGLFAQKPPRSKGIHFDTFLGLECNILGVVCSNSVAIRDEKYLKHRYNTVYDDRNKENHNIMAFSAVYETVSGRANCAQFLTQQFYRHFDLVLSKNLTNWKQTRHLHTRASLSWKFNTKRTARSIWMASIKDSFVSIDDFYKSYRAQQQVDSSAAAGIMCVVSKDYIYIANLGCCGCYMFQIDGTVKAVGKRHTTSSTHERFRIMMSGGKVIAKKRTSRGSTSSSDSPDERSQNQSRRSASNSMRGPEAELIYECYPSSPSTGDDGTNDSMKCDDFQDGPSVEFDLDGERKKKRRPSLIRKMSGKVSKSVKRNLWKIRHLSMKYQGRVLTPSGSREINSSRSSIASVSSTDGFMRSPTDNKFVVIPGNVESTRLFGLLSTKQKCAESYKKSKLWITEPDITMIKRTKKIKGMLLASSGIIDSVPKEHIAWMLNNCCEEASLQSFCDRLCETATVDHGSTACVCSLVALPQHH